MRSKIVFTFNVLTLLTAIFIRVASGQQMSTCTPPLGEQYLEVNNVRARILNTGGLFYRGEPHVYNVPSYSSSNAIFAAGIWIGGMINSQLHIAAASFTNNEFWAGPLDDNGDPPVDCNVYDRVYRVSRVDVINYETTGIAPPDLAGWPTGLGAPTLDSDDRSIDVMTQPLASRSNRVIDLAAGERPDIPGDMAIWWVMNDRGNVHVSTGSLPIGVEVHGLAFAARTSIEAIHNSTLYKYRIFNRNSSTLEDAYIGIFADPDLGDFDDDYVGSDSSLNVGYVYNADNEDGGEEGYGTPPPAVGIAILKGPDSENDGADNDNDGIVDEPGEELGIAHFMYYTNGSGVTQDPITGSDYYRYMQGRWKDGQTLTEGGIGRDFSLNSANFAYPGDPTAGEFWSEVNIDNAGTPALNADRRFVISMGPFTLTPGEEAEIVFAVVYALGTDNLDSVNEMKKATVEVREAFRGGFSGFPRRPEGDRDALVAIYNASGGSDWRNSTNWLTDLPIETWHGVQVQSDSIDGKVTSLELFANGLSGSIPTELTRLTDLQILDLGNNGLSGSIPNELGNLTNLVELNLRNNRLTGPIPPELGNFISLVNLHLGGNRLTGPIPSELGNLASLRSLSLDFNQLTGSIPSEFGNLTNLQILSISTNQLSGPIPAEIGRLTELTIANLSSNQLSGSIPDEFGNLTNITHLHLDHNQLEGAVPSSFNNLSVLDTLSISHNLLSDLPDLSSLVSVTAFEVHENHFTFEDLEPNAALTGAIYSPQANFGEASSVAINDGDPLSLSFTIPGSANQYQWKKQGSPISGATSNPFDILNATLGDAGSYSVDVTNTLVPGLTLQSEAINVVVNEIIIDVTGPAEVEASTGSDIPVSAILPDNYQPQGREVCYRRSAESTYQCIPLVQAGTADSGQIPSDFVTESGVDYYFQFTQGGDVMTIPPGGAEDPFRIRVRVAEIEAGGSFSETTYRMVSVPLELDDPAIESVLDEFGPYDQSNWRLFRWNANRQVFAEHPNISDSFTPCKAFWLISSSGIGFSAVDGTSLHPLLQCGESDLLLRPGWNQFGIPRAYPIDWEDVRTSGVVDAPVHYDATLVSSDPYTYNVTTLVPWDGYWVNNPGTNLVEVTFPSNASSANSGKQRSELDFLSKSEYVLQLHASILELELIDEHNYLGFSSEASDGRDVMDFAEAPGIGSFVRLSLTEEEHRLAGVFKSLSTEGAVWRFEVSAELHKSLLFDGQSVRVAIHELLPRLEGHEIYIIDDDEGRLVRTTAGAFSVMLSSEREVVQYRIIVGTPQYANEVSDGIAIVPQSFALEQNYPNPFNPTTQIRYQLSESSHVLVEIFNTIGQRVQKLVDAEQDVGWYEVTWDGREYGGHSAASGVYFYRLRVGDVTLSRSMILLR